MEFHNYQRMITDMVENFLPRFTNPHVVLSMKIGFRWTSLENDDELTYRKSYWVCFHRPSNYTKVLLNEENCHELINPMNPIKFKLLSDHDSCWREDGMKWIFKTFCDAWDFFEGHGIEGRDIHPHVGFELFGGSPQYWKVDLNIRDNERIAKIKFINKISTNEISEYCEN